MLDRDGTLVEEVGYLRRPEQVRLLPGAARALRDLQAAGYALVVITNQSGLARGYFSEADLAEVHRALADQLQEHEVVLDAIYYCPHHPDDGCLCRKPATALLERACLELNLDLGRSFVVGDRLSDVFGGMQLGCRAILVRTGYGQHEQPRDPVVAVENLAAAARVIIESESRDRPP